MSLALSELPSVYDFLDVRPYLKAYRESRKEIDPGFTHTYICYELGQKNSKGYFNNVVSGRVKIGPTILERFVALLQLDEEEASYFRVLVSYSQCAEIEERERLFRDLIARNRKNCVELTNKALPYYQHWHYAVIRALLDIVDCDGECVSLLKERLLLPLSDKEIKEALRLLQETGLVSPNEEGLLKPADPIVTPSSEIHKGLLLQYQSMNFGHSKEVIVNPDIRPQKSTTMTLSISTNTYDQIKKRIDELKEEIRSLTRHEDGPAERLYQLNMHLFPHSEEI